MDKDLYAVFGVLPIAEPAVIVAAYRALTSLYHPDRWQGDKDEAHQKMSEINAAYEVLGDVGKRCEYDARQTATTGPCKAADEEADQAFDDALDELLGYEVSAIGGGLFRPGVYVWKLDCRRY